jgi:hypothetical protein
MASSIGTGCQSVCDVLAWASRWCLLPRFPSGHAELRPWSFCCRRSAVRRYRMSGACLTTLQALRGPVIIDGHTLSVHELFFLAAHWNSLAEFRAMSTAAQATLPRLACPSLTATGCRMCGQFLDGRPLSQHCWHQAGHRLTLNHPRAADCARRPRHAAPGRLPQCNELHHVPSRRRCRCALTHPKCSSRHAWPMPAAIAAQAHEVANDTGMHLPLHSVMPTPAVQTNVSLNNALTEHQASHNSKTGLCCYR